MTCESCNKIVHSECAKNLFEFDHLSNMWQCWDCNDVNSKRYNPFLSTLYDKYDPVLINESEDITELSRILSSCETFSPSKFNDFLNKNLSFKIYHLLYLITLMETSLTLITLSVTLPSIATRFHL